MEIEKFFSIVSDRLLSVKFTHEAYDEFETLMTNWSDTEFLYTFFDKHQKDLFSGFFDAFDTIDKAVLFTIKEIDDLNARLLECEHDPSVDLDIIFKPLHKSSTSIIREPSKAYGLSPKSWIRIYAIRVESGHYIISGGAIKLTRTMQEMAEGSEELIKLKALEDYLKKNGIEEAYDLKYIDIEWS